MEKNNEVTYKKGDTIGNKVYRGYVIRDFGDTIIFTSSVVKFRMYTDSKNESMIKSMEWLSYDKKGFTTIKALLTEKIKY